MLIFLLIHILAIALVACACLLEDRQSRVLPFRPLITGPSSCGLRLRPFSLVVGPLLAGGLLFALSAIHFLQMPRSYGLD